MVGERLAIYLRHERCGTIVRADSLGYLFAYDSAWLHGHPGEQLSMSLTPQEDPFTPEASRPFFLGLLPEGERRTRLETFHRLRTGDDFGLLERIGGDCAGAVVILPEDSPAPQPGPVATTAIGEAELIDRMRHHGVDPGRRARRLSLAGVQPKEAIWIEPGADPVTAEIRLPEGDQPSTHILKPALSQDYAGIVWNEAFCALLADRMELPVARPVVRTIADVECLIVPRFDRRIGDGEVRRLHQEDFLQALGRTEKYEEHGGPNLADCAQLLRRLSRPVIEIQLFARAVLFNFLIANADAHAKNFSLFHHEGGATEMMPLYDLVCTASYRDLDRSMAMKLGNAALPEDLTRNALDRAATDLGMLPRAFARLAGGLALQVIPAAEAVRREMPQAAAGRTKLILDEIRRRVQCLSDLYGLGIDAQPEPRIDRLPGWP